MNNNFYIRRITPQNAKEVIKDIGFDETYIQYVLPKYDFMLLKIHNLSPPEANILKQIALSTGADAAVHRDVITCKIEKSDLLLGSTRAQLLKFIEKLSYQPFSLKRLAEKLSQFLHNEDNLDNIKIRNKVFEWTKKTYIMGILNITPDSFSDGGKFYELNSAIEQANRMIEAGADIVDIGGESTKPFAEKVNPEEELRRVLPVILKIRDTNTKIPISIDTRHAIVAKEAIMAGVDIVNDISGFDWDPDMLQTVAKLRVPVVIMHSLSDPETMQINPVYNENSIDAISKNLYDKTQRALDAGIKRENIIIDPGIGFGKTLEHNLEIIERISEFKSLGYPILVGVSRKSVISKVLKSSPEEREEANIALGSFLASNGANIIRVHDVEKHFKAFKVLDKIIRQGDQNGSK